MCDARSAPLEGDLARLKTGAPGKSAASPRGRGCQSRQLVRWSGVQLGIRCAGAAVARRAKERREASVCWKGRVIWAG